MFDLSPTSCESYAMHGEDKRRYITCDCGHVSHQVVLRHVNIGYTMQLRGLQVLGTQGNLYTTDDFLWDKSLY